MEQVVASGRRTGPLTLAIDMAAASEGGVLSQAGDMSAGPAHVEGRDPASRTRSSTRSTNLPSRSAGSSEFRSVFRAWCVAGAC